MACPKCARDMLGPQIWFAFSSLQTSYDWYGIWMKYQGMRYIRGMPFFWKHHFLHREAVYLMGNAWTPPVFWHATQWASSHAPWQFWSVPQLGSPSQLSCTPMVLCKFLSGSIAVQGRPYNRSGKLRFLGRPVLSIRWAGSPAVGPCREWVKWRENRQNPHGILVVTIK